jgi:hypothetical protein
MKFIDPARELGADEDVEAFRNIVRKVANPKGQKSDAKGQGLAAA